MPFEYIGEIAHADIAFKAWGGTLEELFDQAARATMQVMVEDLTAVLPKEKVEIKLDDSEVEMLLFDFLNELIFYKDARKLILVPSLIAINQNSTGCFLQATLQGEEIDTARHRMNTDVKAVTMLRFSVEQVQEGWRATVVLDV
jgi:SHS2 domain-containing protein